MPDDTDNNDTYPDPSPEEELYLDELPNEDLNPDARGASPIVQKILLCGISAAIWLSFAIGTWFIYGTSVLRAILLLTFVTIVIGLALTKIFREPQDVAEVRIAARYSQPVVVSARDKRRLLLDDEEVLVEFRHHPMAGWVWWLALSLWLAALVAIIGWVPRTRLDGSWSALKILLIAWAIGLAVISLGLYDAFHDRFMITTRRLVADRGVLTKTFPTMPAKKLTDMKCTVGPFARILAWFRVIETPYGTLQIENAGEREALSTIKYVPNVMMVHKQISRLMLDPAPNLEPDDERQREDGS